MKTPPEVRPILRHDASVMVQRGGLLCKSDQLTSFVPHAGSQDLFEQLRPWLTGEFDLRTIAARTRPDQQQDAVTLIQTLFDRGILRRDDRDRETGELTAAERRAFGAQIDLLHRFTPRPDAAFARYRHSRILLAGEGDARERCAASLLRNGLDTMCQEDTAPRDLREVDLVVYCSDRPNWLDVLRLNRQAAVAERPFLGAAVFEGRSYLGPVIRPVIGGCWLCGVTRTIRDFRDPHVVTDLRAQAIGGFTDDDRVEAPALLARELASDTAFEIFKLRTGVMPAQSDTDMRIERLDHGAPTVTIVPHAQTACRAWCKKVERMPGAR